MSTKRTAENRQILEEASAWFVEFRLSRADKSKHREFMQWLRRSPEHIRAYMEISSAYARIPGPGIVEPAEIERLVERMKSSDQVVALDTALPLDAARRQGAQPYELTAEDAPVRRAPSRRRLAIAAALACFGIAAALATWLVANQAASYETQTAEQRSISLEDGSRIELNARTQVRVTYTSTERRVKLLEGQALFQVAKDSARPFVVNGAGSSVRAVGTRFDVNLLKSGTIVTVLEGKVAVGREGRVASSDVEESGSAFLLAAGEQAVITTTDVARPRRVNIEAATAWRDGELEFDEAPLVEVVETFNRHSRVPLIIESRALDDFRISGIYSSDDTQSLIRFLRNQPDLVVTETDAEIRVRTR